VKPRREKRMTPIGVVKWIGLNARRFSVLMCGRNVIRIVMTMAMIARTPHVSIFLSPLSPSLKSNVMVSQNIIPKMMGGMFPGIN